MPDGTGIELLKKTPLIGVNVTFPYKKIGYDLCDTVSKKANLVGNVNTLHFDGELIHGYNTDVAGFEKLLEETGLKPSTTIIVGAGNVAVTAAAVLVEKGFTVSMTNRTMKRFEDLPVLANQLTKHAAVLNEIERNKNINRVDFFQQVPDAEWSR